ncbi:regulator of G protein signaling domain-containing protein [Ilyonectria sp. MPI-CAGE-AT-0026]|nr:regulator of G protein signaling domain-containing protein [Ilyonectria sp. MPI-CAGE-AT-0026]
MPATQENKMNRSSTGLLRMTDDDRPFSRDLEDLFSTLIVSLMPFSAHRVWFTKVEYTFLSEDAIQNLGSLKFSQSNRMPNPKDPTRIVTTTTTTTFSMSKDMGRSLCQLFLNARFIESADGKSEQQYTMRGTVWQLTPKGIVILERFCSKSGVQLKQLGELTNLFSIQLITLERDAETDKLFQDESIVQVIFSRFAGAKGQGSQSPPGTGESSFSGDQKSSPGVKVAAERRVNGRLYLNTFTGKAGLDWLMENSTTIDWQEAIEVASLFVRHNLVEQVLQDQDLPSPSDPKLFQPSKGALYRITSRGKSPVSSNPSRSGSQNKREAASQHYNSKDSNTHRLDKILSDPTLRLLFRENLREMHCEENLSFYLEVDGFIRNCKAATRNLQQSTDEASSDKAKDLLALSYGIYNAYLAPGSPRELNIHHQLRKSLASRMTKVAAEDNTIAEVLREVTSLFEDAQSAVFKLMTSDSVPKFLQNPKHAFQIANAGLH